MSESIKLHYKCHKDNTAAKNKQFRLHLGGMARWKRVQKTDGFSQHLRTC